jgi:hypothetical protein
LKKVFLVGCGAKPCHYASNGRRLFDAKRQMERHVWNNKSLAAARLLLFIFLFQNLKHYPCPEAKSIDEYFFVAVK